MNLKELYYKVNNVNSSKYDIEDTINVNFLDVLKEKEMEVETKGIVKCKCVENAHKSAYYDKCDCCNGKGKVAVLGEELTCGKCKGKGIISIRPCPICHGNTETLGTLVRKIKLSRDMLSTNSLNIATEKENILLHLNIVDRDYFDIKNNDVYSKKIIIFKKNELKGKKQVETAGGTATLTIDKSIYQQVICLEKEGMNGGNFYQPVRCEVEQEKGEDIYSNIILNEPVKGVYISKQEIFNKCKILNYKLYVPSGDQNYIYVDLIGVSNYDTISIKNAGKVLSNGGAAGDLTIRVFFGTYKIVENSLFRDDEILTKSEISNMKKIVIINKKKISVPFAEFNNYLLLGNYGLLKDNGESSPLYTMIKKEEL